MSAAVTVTVLIAPSATVSGDTVSMTIVDAKSFSVIARIAGAGSVIAKAFSARPDTVTLLAGAWTLLSAAMTVTVPVLAVCSASMVSTDPLSV